MTTAQIEQKITDTENLFEMDKKTLENLRSERAKLLLDGKDTKDKDKAIFRLEHITANAPAVITELESQLTSAQKKTEQTERNKLLSQQKKIAAEVESLSKELVAILGTAMEINGKLNSAYHQYCLLRKSTGESVISQNVTQGSAGMLKYVYEVCQKEVSGKPVMRQPMVAVPI